MEWRLLAFQLRTQKRIFFLTNLVQSIKKVNYIEKKQDKKEEKKKGRGDILHMCVCTCINIHTHIYTLYITYYIYMHTHRPVIVLKKCCVPWSSHNLNLVKGYGIMWKFPEENSQNKEKW